MKSDQIATEVAQYAPSVLSMIIAVEQSAHQLTGKTKAQIVADSILAGAQELTAVPNPKVASMFAMISMFVGILNATKVFNHGASPNSSAAKVNGAKPVEPGKVAAVPDRRFTVDDGDGPPLA